MFARYPKIINYYRALPILYTVKRRAEVAPGVGKESDWIFITRDGSESIYPGLIQELDKSYEEFRIAAEAKLADVEERLAEVLRIATESAVPPDQASAKTVDLNIPPTPHRSQATRLSGKGTGADAC
jgi:hypothetical protein